MKKSVESRTTENSDDGAMPIYAVTYGAPSEFSDAELQECVAIIHALEAVDPVRRRVPAVAMK
jgi:hypothetical protein